MRTGRARRKRVVAGVTEQDLRMEFGATGEATAAAPSMTIVIPTRDGTATLGAAVRSALRHASCSEVIVVDDGSDPPVDGARLSIDDRLRVMRSDGVGVSAARNEGARRAGGSIIAFLDDDDILLEGWHDAVVRAFDDDRVGIVCVGIRMIESTGGRVTVRDPRPMGPLGADRTGLFLAGSFATRTHLFASIGGYDEGLRFSENTELSIRLVRAAIDANLTIRSINGPLLEITRREVRQRRTGAADRLRAAEHILQAHDEVFRLHPAARAGYMRIAGVSAAQSGDLRTARRWFSAIVRAKPMSVADWGRLAAAFIPPCARIVWSAPVRPGDGRTGPG